MFLKVTDRQSEGDEKDIFHTQKKPQHAQQWRIFKQKRSEKSHHTYLHSSSTDYSFIKSVCIVSVEGVNVK